MQIGKHIWQLECARLAANQLKTNTKSEMPNVDICGDGMRINLNVHYEISNSWNDAVNIYNFICSHRSDPAIMVSLTFELYDYYLS